MSHLRSIRPPAHLLFIDIFILRQPMTTSMEAIATSNAAAPNSKSTPLSGNFPFSRWLGSVDHYHHHVPHRLGHQSQPVATPVRPSSAFPSITSACLCLSPPTRPTLFTCPTTHLPAHVNVRVQLPSLATKSNSVS